MSYELISKASGVVEQRDGADPSKPRDRLLGILLLDGNPSERSFGSDGYRRYGRSLELREPCAWFSGL